MAARLVLGVTVALGLALRAAGTGAATPDPPARVEIVHDGLLLHRAVRTVTVLPGEPLPLTSPGGRRLAPAPHGAPFELRMSTETAAAELQWKADRGTIAGGPPRSARYLAPATPGVDHLRLARPGEPPVFDLLVLVLTPFDAARDGMLSGYRIGRYPDRPDPRPGARDQQDAPIRGFVRVTPDIEDLALSRHFRLRDFLCKQQPEHAPKYLVLDVRLLDKLEHLVDRLEHDGHTGARLTIMSGYRTPFYNRAIGNETAWSRHTHGDAADVFVDDDGDGVMDDLDGDGRITRADAEVLLRAVDALDQDLSLSGGAAAYAATPAHGPFVHLDVRGRRARW